MCLNGQVVNICITIHTDSLAGPLMQGSLSTSAVPAPCNISTEWLMPSHSSPSHPLPGPAPEDTVHSPVHALGKLEILWIQHGAVISRVIKKLHGLSPQANYTDRVTPACQQS
jgi:hypothetical protein